MANQANIKAVITADDRASATLKKFGSNTSALGKALGTGLKTVAIGATAAGAAAVAFGAVSVKAFTESEDAIAQTNAVLKSTKGIAGVTEKSVEKLASSLQNVTKFSDEQVRSGENLLLTFTKIGKDIFPEATKTMLDMSQALGQDVKSSAIQLGKALQDPILGITALRRVGVNFSDDQKDVVKNLVETGRAAEAQKLILKELATEFGGSATEAGKTFSGQMEILKNKFNDMQEIVGGKLAVALGGLLDKLNKWIDSMGGASGVVESVTNWLSRLWASLSYVGSIIANMLGPSMNALIETLKTELLPSLQALWTLVGPTLGPAMKAFAMTIGAVIIGALWLLINTLNVLAKALAWAINGFVEFENRAVAAIKSVKGAADSLYNSLRRVFDYVANAIPNANKSIKNMVNKLTGGLLGKIPGFATGTNFAPGGVAMVGERGPELVQLPRGSKVTPNDQLPSRAGDTYNVTVQAGVMTGTDADMRKLSAMVVQSIKDIASSKGTNAVELLA